MIHGKWIGLSAALLMTGMAWASPQVGQAAPEFTAVDITGKSHQLSDYRGKIVVLEAYNFDCPFVVNHYNRGAMQELQAELAKQGVVWLLVNSTHPDHPNYRDPAAAKEEWNRLKIKATAWLHDPEGELGRKYQMRTTPHMYVIDAKGVLVYQGAIDDRARADGDPRTARNYVKEVVGQLMEGRDVAVSQTRPYGCSVKYTADS
jgi:peroxiredoxin